MGEGGGLLKLLPLFDISTASLVILWLQFFKIKVSISILLGGLVSTECDKDEASLRLCKPICNY